VARTIYYCATSLDGYLAEADDGLEWLLGYDGSFEGGGAEPGPMSEGGAYERFYAGVGALVAGSVTYEWILDHLAGGERGWPYAGKPFWVLSSRRLRVPEGEGVDVRVVDASARDLHGELIAAADGGDVWIVGGGGVASQFAEESLLDEVHVTVVPVALGTGKPLFAGPLPGGPLRLTGTRTFDNGMVELRYEVPR
jgi:dihydrofolate reductase